MNQSKQPARVGFVLAGGTSSRMGADKAFLEFQGQTLLERALALIGRVCPSAAIVGDPARFSSYGAVVEDVYTGCGPLAGIHAALTRSYAELNLMLAVDLPFVSEDLLSYLFSVAEETSAVVTVPRTGKGFQPLCAVYRPEFATVADRALQAAKYKIDALPRIRSSPLSPTCLSCHADADACRRSISLHRVQERLQIFRRPRGLRGR